MITEGQYLSQVIIVDSEEAANVYFPVSLSVDDGFIFTFNDLLASLKNEVENSDQQELIKFLLKGKKESFISSFQWLEDITAVVSHAAKSYEAENSIQHTNCSRSKIF